MISILSFGLVVIGVIILIMSLNMSYKAHCGMTREKPDAAPAYIKLGIGAFFLFGFLAMVLLWAGPMYTVWQKGKAGEAALAEATANRQILIQEAAAKEEAAKHLAEAEIIRSHGIAEANEIVSESLRGNSMYLQYLYIQSLKESENKVIYVPITSQGLPLLESARLLDDGVTVNNMPQESSDE